MTRQGRVRRWEGGVCCRWQHAVCWTVRGLSLGEEGRGDTEGMQVKALGEAVWGTADKGVDPTWPRAVEARAL